MAGFPHCKMFACPVQNICEDAKNYAQNKHKKNGKKETGKRRKEKNSKSKIMQTAKSKLLQKMAGGNLLQKNVGKNCYILCRRLYVAVCGAFPINKSNFCRNRTSAAWIPCR